MRLKEELIKRDIKLTELIKKLDGSLADAPSGTLRVANNSDQPKYYVCTKPSDRAGKYVRKDELYKAAALAQRDYDMAVKSAAMTEQRAINNLLKIRECNLPEDIYSKLILPRKKLVDSHFLTDEEFAARWLAEPYKPKGFEEGSPDYRSTDGTRVRSKSEAILGDIFDDCGIPKKFECPVTLWNGKVIHPDYTLLNVRRRLVFIWEHFGKADDPDYMEYNTGRLNDLIRSGFYPGINLILTFETKNKPLDTNVVRALIEQFLL